MWGTRSEFGDGDMGFTGDAFGGYTGARNPTLDSVASIIDFWVEPRLGGVLDADGNAASDGEKVATAQDLSSSAAHLTQTDDAKRFVYVAESEYSGTPCIRNNAGGHMGNAVWNGWNDTPGQCWVVVMKPTGVTAGEVIAEYSAGQENFHLYRTTTHYSVGSYTPSAGSFPLPTAGGQLIMAIHDGSGVGNAQRMKMRLNKTDRTAIGYSFTVPATYHSTFPGLFVGGASWSAQYTNGDYFLLLHLNAAPTPEQIADIEAYCEYHYFARAQASSRIICEGDSRTKGITDNITTDPPYSYPAQLAALFGGNAYDYNQDPIGTIDYSKRWTTFNLGQEGDEITAGITTAIPGITIRRDEWLKDDIVVLWAAINDVTTGETGAAISSAVKNWGEEMQGAGFTVVVCTEIGTGTAAGVPNLTPAMTVERDASNAVLIADQATFCDALVRLDADPLFNNAVDGDGIFDLTAVHFSHAGYAAIAAKIKADGIDEVANP